jgi:hypothetical protein
MFHASPSVLCANVDSRSASNRPQGSAQHPMKPTMTTHLHLERLLLAFLLFASSQWMLAQHRDVADCVVKVASEWGAECEKCEVYKDGYKRDHSGTYQVLLSNDCSELVEVKVAMQEHNGQWRTFPLKVLAPEETMKTYACTGTGRYMYWARRVNDTEIVIPSDQEILSEYRSR